MTRILVAIDDQHLRELDRVANKARRSRAALVREAIDEFLKRRGGSPREDAFGLWIDEAVDGLAYQRKLRDEW